MNSSQTRDFATYREIISQPAAWRSAWTHAREAALPRAADYDHVLFTGCGSTYYLSLAAAALYQSLTGRPASATPGGELLLNPETALSHGRTLLIAVSRSGTTTETLKAVERFKERKRGEVIVITNYNTALAAMGDVAIVIPEGREQSVAQTRSFASMFVAATALCVRMADDPNGLLASMEALPEAGERLIGRYEGLAREIGENLDFDRYYFLGSGIRYGLASEVNLKMKEMTLTHSEPFHFLEFRHGPMSMVNNKAVVVGLLSQKNTDHEQTVLREMQELGGTILSLGERSADISFQSGIPEAVRGVLYLPALQLMAYYRSLAKGLNPDRPTNLTAVVELSELV